MDMNNNELTSPFVYSFIHVNKVLQYHQQWRPAVIRVHQKCTIRPEVTTKFDMTSCVTQYLVSVSTDANFSVDVIHAQLDVIHTQLDGRKQPLAW